MDYLKNLKILSLNVNSLNLSTYNRNINGSYCNLMSKKLESILQHDCNIIFLQDVRGGQKLHFVENYLMNTNYGAFDIFANSTQESRGVMILINKKNNYTITNVVKSFDQNYIILKLLLDDFLINLVSVYGPNTSNQAFYNNLYNDIRDLNSRYTILGGDFNICFNDYDRLNFVARANHYEQNKNYLMELMRNLDLSDNFRTKHPDLRRYFYRSIYVNPGV